jgi:hypothetical protein
MKQYLPGAGFFGFGCDAAHVLKDIYERGKKLKKHKYFMFRSYFSEVRARRLERQDENATCESSSFSDAIFAVIDDLVKPDAGEQAHRHALELATIAFSLPYDNRTTVIDALLRLPLPLSEKQGLLRALVLAGEIINADMVLEGIKTLLEEAKTKHWLLNENQGRLEGWLELLPFSDRPEATIDALDLLDPNLRQPRRLARLLSALGHAPSPDAEHVLDILAQRDARFLSERDWLSALDNRGTVSAARILLRLIGEGAFDSRASGMDTWTLSLKLATAMRAHPELRAEVYQQFEHVPAVTGKAILEHAIAEAADTDGVLILVRSHATQGKPFDAILYSAIRHAVVGERPSAHWVGTQEVFSLPSPELRKRLFSMINGETAESKLAEACLTAIDELRDDYGPVESEPRHPDIDSGRPWPLAAGQSEL